MVNKVDRIDELASDVDYMSLEISTVVTRFSGRTLPIYVISAISRTARH